MLRADDLSQLSADGLQALADYGVRTILDLRWPEEAARHPSPVPGALPQVHYQRISLLSHTEDEWHLRSRNSAKELWKCVVLEHVRDELRGVLSFIAAAPPEPLLFHCIAGKDRTGLVAALLLTLADATPQAIAHDYAVSADNLRAGYLERYATALALSDVPFFSDGGNAYTLGQPILREFMNEFRRLPADRFASRSDAQDPVAVRELKRKDDFLFYAIMPSSAEIA